MHREDTKSQFSARLLRPQSAGDGKPWAFVVLPREASAKLPRRGRVTVDGAMNGHRFQPLLEPDGQKSHWLKLDEQLLKDSGADFGDVAQFEIMAVEQEPEPEVPADLGNALQAAPEARHLGGDDHHRALGLDSLDYISQAGEDAHEADK